MIISSIRSLVYAPATGERQSSRASSTSWRFRNGSAPRLPRIFDRPLKRSEELKIWYLHVWAWEWKKPSAGPTSGRGVDDLRIRGRSLRERVYRVRQSLLNPSFSAISAHEKAARLPSLWTA